MIEVWDSNASRWVYVATETCCNKRCFSPKPFHEANVVVPGFGNIYRYETMFFKCSQLSESCYQTVTETVDLSVER